jgi:hypothetical protein
VDVGREGLLGFVVPGKFRGLTRLRIVLEVRRAEWISDDVSD